MKSLEAQASRMKQSQERVPARLLMVRMVPQSQNSLQNLKHRGEDGFALMRAAVDAGQAQHRNPRRPGRKHAAKPGS